MHDDRMPDDEPPFRYSAAMAARIEARWQRRWAREHTFETPNPVGPLAEGFGRFAGRPVSYVLDMFPYPSGTALHVGHPLGYIGTDVFARYQRMNGHHVLHTLGYDAFGLPAEQHAIATGLHPRAAVAANIATMRAQVRRLGIGHDPRREVVTADPGYYRWTQWIFGRIFDSWCDERTGRARPIAELAAEFAAGRRPVPGGRAWADLTRAEQRVLIDQRRLAYLSDEPVNWCPALGTVLANEEVTADGRSVLGDHPVERRPVRQWKLRITAYVDRLAADLDGLDWPEPVKRMQRNWIGATDGAIIALLAAGGGTGTVEVFTTRPDTLPAATFVVLAPEHPAAVRLAADRDPGAPADQDPGRPAGRAGRARGAMTGFFTGSHVTNPATGEPIPVFVSDYVSADFGTGAIMAVPAEDDRDRAFAERFGLPVRPVAGVPAPWGEAAEPVRAAVDWLERTGIGRPARAYRLRDWLFSRQRYWGEPFPIVYDAEGAPVLLPDDMLPVELPPMTDFGPVDGGAGEPIPPLGRAHGWASVELDLGEGSRRYRREVNTMPQWAGSCWYYLRYLDPANDRRFVDPRIERYWMSAPPGSPPGAGGVGLYVGGVEHAVLHLLYARFWHKVLYDLGHVSTAEPFARLFNQGYILADAFRDERGVYVPAAEVTTGPDGRPSYRGRPVTRRAGKMGKSLRNGIAPDEICDRYGADTLRLYEMAMGPLDADRPWRTGDIAGMHRLLQRLWRCVVDENTGRTAVSDDRPDDALLRVLHSSIAAIRGDIEALRFHTAIVRLAELTAAAGRAAAGTGSLPRSVAEPMVLLLAPFAPHIAEELWARLGHRESLAYQPFPRPEPELAAAAALSLPVQVDGRTRFTITVGGADGEAEIGRILRADPAFARFTADRDVQRVIIVPGRIVSVVTAQRGRDRRRPADSIEP